MLRAAGAAPAEAVYLAAVLDAVRLDLSPLLARAQLTVTAGLHDHFPPHNLRSVVYNLLSNALKYRRPDRPAVVHLRAYVADQTAGAWIRPSKNNYSASFNACTPMSRARALASTWSSAWAKMPAQPSPVRREYARDGQSRAPSGVPAVTRGPAAGQRGGTAYHNDARRRAARGGAGRQALESGKGGRPVASTLWPATAPGVVA
jgi:hypothetical protein